MEGSAAVDKIKQWMYYFIIGIISLIALTFLPMIGSTIGLGWNIPNTMVGWIVWVAVKIIVAVINVLIFHSFMCQAKLNVKDNKKYKEANEILGKIKIKNFIPRSPKKWNTQQYTKKGTMIFITTALATVALTQAILTFDWIAMLTYLFTIIMGLIFGVLQMKSAEEYWTDEFWKYAIMVKEQQEEAERKTKEELALAQENSNKQRDVSLDDIERGRFLGTCVDKRIVSLDCEPVVLDCNNSSDCVLGGTVYPSNAITDSTCLWVENPVAENNKETHDNGPVCVTNQKGEQQ